MVQGVCIEEGHGHSRNETKSSLPSEDFFIKDLFKEKEHLSEEDLEEIVESLGIGKVSESPTSPSSGDDSHDDHEDDHGHRRRRSAGSFVLPLQGSTASRNVHRRALDEHDHHTNGHQTNDTSGRVSVSNHS